MDIEREFRGAATSLHHERPHRDVGDEAAVHHVHVDPVRARGFAGREVRAEAGEIGGEDGGGDERFHGFHALGCKAGVTLNPSTPALALEPVLPLVDLVLVLTVNPGFSGQKFLPEVLPKIGQLRGMLDAVNPSARLEVDGGLSSATLPEVQKRGADVFVAGSFVFGHPQGIAGGIRALRECVARNG